MQRFSIVGWAMPTKYRQSRLLAVGNAHPTPAILDLTDGEFQIHNSKYVLFYYLRGFMTKFSVNYGG
jgi:hypothetical protein